MRNSSNTWTFFTNHSHVLFYIVSHPELPMREIAAKVEITERAVHGIIRDLNAAGVLTVNKVGRRNTYKIHKNISLRHPIESHRKVSDLISFIQSKQGNLWLN